MQIGTLAVTLQEGLLLWLRLLFSKRMGKCHGRSRIRSTRRQLSRFSILLALVCQSLTGTRSAQKGGLLGGEGLFLFVLFKANKFPASVFQFSLLGFFQLLEIFKD